MQPETPTWHLEADEPAPFQLDNAQGTSPFVIIIDHAGQAIPRARGDVGGPAAARPRHIGWDIGAGKLGLELSRRLDAALVKQNYSRLVIDCNRDPVRADAMLEISDGTPIPVNLELDADARAARVAGVHAPYHRGIADLLDARGSRPTALILLHSFTAVMRGLARPWHYGVLHDGGALALAMLARLRAETPGPIGDNEPYAMDAVDYTAFRHGRDRGLEFVEIEVRQDLLLDAGGRAEVATLLARLLPEALAAAS
jgi:predicted N-formylglutamate amidohydrolase